MVKLIIETLEYDITAYIDESSLVYSDNIDETKAHAGVSIPFIKQNDIKGLDMSIPLKRLTHAIIEIDEEYSYWCVSEDKVDKVRKGDSPLYSHEISLIEPTILLEGRPLPDMSVTQPKSELSNYIYILNSIKNEVTIEDVLGTDINSSYEQTGVKANNTLATLAFNYGISNDTSVIEDNVLKEVREYEIFLNYEIYNIQSLFTSPEAELELTVYADGTLITGATFTTSVPKAVIKGFFSPTIYPFSIVEPQKFTYTPSGIGEVITIKVRTTGMYQPDTLNPPTYEDELWITKMGFNIQTFEVGTSSKIMLDDVADKILLISPSAPLSEPEQEFTLATQTRNRISTIPSPEFTFTGYTVFDAINEVASYVGAIPYLGNEDWSTIYFLFFDDVEVESDIDYLEEEQNVYLTDYVTGLEINAQNVINEDSERYVKVEPSETGWLTIRTTDVGVITDANSAIHTTRPFYRSHKVLVKGLAFTMYNGATPVTFANTLEWDISNFVVEQTKWNATLNQAADTRTGALNKGNTIYYTQGQKMLFNIGYNDVILAPLWNTALAANYAIVEAILCQAAVENPTYTFNNDYQPSISLFDIEVRVYYIPYVNARVTVYRDDAATLNPATKYFNEQASINDMKSLGDIAHKHANRKGNPISTYKGITNNMYNLIRLGMKNDRGEILTSYEVATSPLLREFVLHYSKDNPNISAYKGTPSAYRQYEVPTTDLVYRKDKYSEFVYFSEFDDTSIYSIYATDQILVNFQPTPTGEKITYAVVELDYDGLGYTETVEATVDALAFGTTTALQIELADNYSAGAKQVVDTPLSQVRQADTLYGDEFGNVENIKITTFITNTISDKDNYPDNDTSTTSGYESQLELQVKKDAREIWGITQELVFRSAYANVKVYSGMAKFNGVVTEGSTVETRPLLLKKGYFPINETIDFAKTIQTTWDSTITNNELNTEIDAPTGEYEGYIWMEMTTKTPIFAVRTSDFDTVSPATLNHSVYHAISYALIVSNYAVDLESDIVVTDSLTATGFVFPIESLTSAITIADTLILIKSTDFVIDLVDTLSVSTSINEFMFEMPTLNLTDLITINDTLILIKSTDFVIDLVDTLSISATINEVMFEMPTLNLTDLITISDTMNLFQSTNFNIDLVGTLSVISSTISVSVESSHYVVDLTSDIVIADTINAFKSTDYVIDLVDTLAISTSINEIISTDYVVDLTSSLTISDTINAYISTNFVIDLTDTMSMTSTIDDNRYTTNWVYTGTSGVYDKSVSNVQEGLLCVSIYSLDSWLNTNYPATDYTYGYVIRVLRYRERGAACSPLAYYFQAS